MKSKLLITTALVAVLSAADVNAEEINTDTTIVNKEVTKLEAEISKLEQQIENIKSS